MKKLVLMLALAAAPNALIACSGDEDETTGDGDGDHHDHECSVEEFETPAAGGAGGAPAAMCDMPEAPHDEIEIAGDYTDNFGGTHEITNSTWGTIALSIVNNEENYAVGRNTTDAFSPCLWSLLVWHEEDGQLYYCQAAFDATSECAAEEAPKPDSDDLEAGCSGFGWSQLTAD